MIFSVKERQMEHLVNDLLHCRLQAWTFPAGIEARWLGEGIFTAAADGAVAPGDDPLRRRAWQ
ncbi:succinylglutamate desuccinylase [Klebsiella pneumoniae]|uniref:Succinylglutamate desuccinylase n=1 Tax=Klebsiella pneumoniae TaxID=573 RepID=A0A377ZSS8_KLEPN|nr:succinylglutamate desuccinylase [Klebsiella pneumoniae]